MGVKRLPICRVLLLLSAMAVGKAVGAGDWTSDPPPGGNRSAMSRQAAGPDADRSGAPLRTASFDPDAWQTAQSIEQPTPAGAAPTPAQAPSQPVGPTDFEEFEAADGSLLPIAMPDDVEEGLPPPARTLSSGKWINRGRWYTIQEALFLNRSERKSTNLATDFSDTNEIAPTARARLRTTRGLGFTPGARLTLGCFLGRDPLNRDSSVEFTFFGIANWSETRGLNSVAPNGLYTDFDPSFSVPGFTQANSMQYAYMSHFNSYEVNFRLARRPGRDRMILTRQGDWVREITPSALTTLIGGFRLATLNESFNWQSQGTDPTANFGQYNVRTHNALFGFQLGADLRYQQADWRFGVTVKGGPYINFADQFSNINAIGTNTTGPTPVVTTLNNNLSNQATPLSFLGEININTSYFFRPNMALRAGYTVLLISDLALADKQISFFQTSPAKLSTAIGTAIQGANVGFEFYW